MIINLKNGHTVRWDGTTHLNFADEQGKHYYTLSFILNKKSNPTQLDALGIFLAYGNMEVTA